MSRDRNEIDLHDTDLSNHSSVVATRAVNPIELDRPLHRSQQMGFERSLQKRKLEREQLEKRLQLRWLNRRREVIAVKLAHE